MTYNDGHLKSIPHPSEPDDLDVDPMLKIGAVWHNPDLVELTIFGPKHGTKGMVRVDRWQLLQVLGLNITPPKPEPMSQISIVSVMAKHIYNNRNIACGCGKPFRLYSPDSESIAEQYRMHLAEQIAEAQA